MKDNIYILKTVCNTCSLSKDIIYKKSKIDTSKICCNILAYNEQLQRRTLKIKASSQYHKILLYLTVYISLNLK